MVQLHYVPRGVNSTMENLNAAPIFLMPWARAYFTE